MRTCILVIAVLVCCATVQSSPQLINTVKQWHRLEFRYTSEAARQEDINNGIYDPDVPVPIDIDVFYRSIYERILFVSIPKFGPGVPATFGIVTDQANGLDPLIDPFPSWDWHQDTKKCKPNRLVSVFRVKIDRCGLLWILDSGNEGDGVICKPQLVVFDLKQWPRIKFPYYRYEFPSAVYMNDSLFVTPVIEVLGSDCKQGAFAYVADTTRRANVVTDLNAQYSWRITDRSMDPEPAFSVFNISGESFFLDDGIMGMDLSPERRDNTDRTLYYWALSSSKAASITTNALKNAIHHPPYITRYPGQRTSQAAAMAISRRNVAFFGLASDLSINCWNIKSNDYGPYIHQVYYNAVTMQFASGVKLVVNPYGVEELWVTTIRFQKLMNDGYNFNEVNFRVSMGSVDDLLENSRCIYPNY